MPRQRDGDEIPTGKVRRATSTTAALGPSSAKLAGTMITSMARSPERAREVLLERHIEVADAAVAVLGNLRGGAMKIGQLASFVDVDFLPPEYREIYQERLAGLRDAAPAMGWEKVRKLLESALEQPVDEVFTEISHEALAAASIGQVHRATLCDGRRVAVKIQYPEIADALAADLDVASVLIRLAKALAPGLDPEVIAGELRERVLEELDFELEAQNQRTFAR
ncbi:MAG TPA: AarF/UbiB family protein, partial [Solirubrobacteraceae bacterium]|nr:AarF/UbiB family protein [Solirubrobacteraceae bacterium]